MLVNTGEQILEMLVIGGVIFAAAAILIIVMLIMRKKRATQDEDVETNDEIKEDKMTDADETDDTPKTTTGSNDFTISKETKTSGEDE